VAKVYLPFNLRFKEPMLEGVKIWSSRSRWFGKVGDTFEAFGSTFEIIDKKRLKLGIVVADHWKEEGFYGIEDFIETWRKIHPVRGFDSDWTVCVHIFSKRLN